MAIMRNMTETEVKEMEALFEKNIKPKNSEATFETFTMLGNTNNNIERLEDKISDLSIQLQQLEHFIKTIFDGHVLIDGKFMKIIP